MTTYNGAKHIREQLNSILAQTETDFEVVICDDASNDSTQKILAEYASKDSRFHIYMRKIWDIGKILTKRFLFAKATL